MAKMFIAGRFKTMAVLDKKSIEKELKNNNFSNFNYADYKEKNIIEILYAFPLTNDKNKRIIYQKINKIIKEMIDNGEIYKIYNEFNININEFK